MRKLISLFLLMPALVYSQKAQLKSVDSTFTLKTFITAGPEATMRWTDNIWIWTDTTEFTQALRLKELTVIPGTPESGIGRVYVKDSDSDLYFKNDSGVESSLTAAAAGGGQWTDFGTFLKPSDAGDIAIHITDTAENDSVIVAIDGLGNVTFTTTTGNIIWTTGNTGDAAFQLPASSVSSTEILNATILDADINASAAIASSKLADEANIAFLNQAETIASNWLNTANPWATNEIVDAYLLNTGDTSTGELIIIRSGNLLTVTNTVDLASGDRPGIIVESNDPTPLDGDEIRIQFRHSDDLGNQTAYGEIDVAAMDVTDGTEDGMLGLDALQTGTMREVATFGWTASSVGAATINPSNLDIDFIVHGDVSSNILTVDAVTNITNINELTLTTNLAYAEMAFSNNIVAGDIATGAIATAEILDGTILEADFDATNAPTDNFILSFNSAGGNFTWVVDATGGTTVWSDIGDPSNSGLTTITFDNAETSLLTGNNDAVVDFFTIQNTDADHANNMYLLNLDYSADDADVDADFIKFQDSGSIVMTIQQNGVIATDGNITSLGTIEGAVLTEGGVAVYDETSADAAHEAELDDSAGLIAALSDETGTLLAVFSDAPTFTTNITVPTVIAGLIDPAGAVDLDLGSADILDVRIETDGGVVVIDGSITQDAGTTLFMGGLLDATGAVDMDYGSGDITDHTFVSDGGTAIIDGSITAVGSFIIGSADMSETDLEKLDGITDGAGAANKALVLDASADIASGLANLTASATITVPTVLAGLIDPAGAVDLDLGSADVTDVTTTTDGGTVIFDGSISTSQGATASGLLIILEDTDAGTNFASFQVPALAANTAYILPTAFGSSGFQLTDAAGDGVLSWAAASGAAAHDGTITWTGTSILETGVAFQFGDASDATLTHTYANTGTNVSIAYSTAAMAVTGALTATNLSGTNTGDENLKSKSFIIISPVATDDYPLWEAPYNYTITAIHILVVGGTNVVGGLDEADSNGLNPVAIDADLTGTAGTASDDDGSLTNPTVDDGDYLFWHTTSISGTPTSLTVTIEFTID